MATFHVKSGGHLGLLSSVDGHKNRVAGTREQGDLTAPPAPNHHAFPHMTSPTPQKPNPRRVEVAMNPLKNVLCVPAGKCSKAMLLLSVVLSLSCRAADAFSVPHTSSSAFLRLRASHAIPSLSKRHGLPSGTWFRARTRAGFTGVRAQENAQEKVKFGLGISAIPIEVLTMPGPPPRPQLFSADHD